MLKTMKWKCFTLLLEKRLFAGRLPANSELFAGRLPENSELFAGRLPANSGLFAGRLPVNNELFYGRLQANIVTASDQDRLTLTSRSGVIK